MEKMHNIPRSIGVIMDGNRRYAKEQGLPAMVGHKLGYAKLKEFLGWCRDAGIEHVTVFAFSTENWKRKSEEVGYLMELFRVAIGEVDEYAKKEKMRVYFPGDRSAFSADLQEAMERVERETSMNNSRTISIALSYGGRAEIVDAIRRIPKEKIETIGEEEFSRLLWTANTPDPDMVIRTSGEKRLSGFLTWSSVYSELFFTDTYWPAFTKEEFTAMLKEYDERERRYGA